MGKKGISSPVGMTEDDVSKSIFDRPYGTKGDFAVTEPSDKFAGLISNAPTGQIGVWYERRRTFNSACFIHLS